MKARKKTNRKPKSSRARNRRLAQKQTCALNFETLEPKQMLAAITVGNANDLVNADVTSISALTSNNGGQRWDLTSGSDHGC